MRQSLLVLFSLAFLLACDPGGIGDGCQGGAVENDCVEGALCTLERNPDVVPPDNPNNERFTCRSICDSQSDCEAGFACRRAEGTMLDSCQPEPAMPGSDAGP